MNATTKLPEKAPEKPAKPVKVVATRQGYIYNKLRTPGSFFILQVEDLHLIDDKDKRRASWIEPADKLTKREVAQLKYEELDDAEIDSSFDE